MGFQSLRAMKNDTIKPGGSFPMHPHKDMETTMNIPRRDDPV